PRLFQSGVGFGIGRQDLQPRASADDVSAGRAEHSLVKGIVFGLVSASLAGGFAVEMGIRGPGRKAIGVLPVILVLSRGLRDVEPGLNLLQRVAELFRRKRVGFLLPSPR